MRSLDVARLLHEHLEVTVVSPYGSHSRTSSEVVPTVPGKS